MRRAAWALAGLAWAVTLASPGVAEEPSSQAGTVRKTSQGLHFNVPPDWPIEERGGVVAPIPIEEYLAKKFGAIEARLQALEQRFNGLDIRMRVLEEAIKAKAPAGGLRSTEQQPPPTPSP